MAGSDHVMDGASAPDAGVSPGVDAPSTSPDAGRPPAKVCPSGAHDCSGVCVDSASPLHCGVSCQPCVAPLHGEATCSAGACGGRCAAGAKLCGGECVPEATTCGSGCNPGFHVCGATCKDDTSTDSCGTSCTPCLTAEFTVPVCEAGMCHLRCTPGAQMCFGDCTELSTSAKHCGVCGHACPFGCQAGSCRCQGMPGNLVPNPNFDTGATGWQVSDFATSSWVKDEDASGCAGSGSARVVFKPTEVAGDTRIASPCFAVQEGRMYDHGGWGRQPAQTADGFNPQAQVVLTFYADQQCTLERGRSRADWDVSHGVAVWAHSKARAVATGPWAQVTLVVEGPAPVLFDAVYVVPTP